MTEPTLEAIEKAYGLLWSDSSASAWSHEARRVLLAALDNEGQKRGIDYSLKNRPSRDYVPVPVTGIWLKNIGEFVVVEAESDGRWVEVIRERADGAFSHIVEPGGMRKALVASLTARLRSSEVR